MYVVTNMQRYEKNGTLRTLVIFAPPQGPPIRLLVIKNKPRQPSLIKSIKSIAPIKSIASIQSILSIQSIPSIKSIQSQCTDTR